jgi:hypothetical protein
LEEPWRRVRLICGPRPDAGLLLLREAERRLDVCRRLADAMPDRRDADRIRHAMFEMVMARVSAVACGHKDVIDLDRLRHGPLMKLAVGRRPPNQISPITVPNPSSICARVIRQLM